MFIPVFPPPFSPFSKNRLIYNCCSVPRFCQDRGTFQNTNKSRELGTFQDFSGWNLLKSNVDFRKCLPKRAESNLVPMNGKNVFFKLFKADLVISCAKDNIFCLLLPSAKDVWCHIMKRALTLPCKTVLVLPTDFWDSFSNIVFAYLPAWVGRTYPVFIRPL